MYLVSVVWSSITVAGKDQNNVKEKRKKRKRSVQKYYNKKASDLPKLCQQQNVYFKLKEHERWTLGEVKNYIGENPYNIQAQNGAIYRRNRMHIRPTQIEVVIRNASLNHDRKPEQHSCVMQPEMTQRTINPGRDPPNSERKVKCDFLADNVSNW